MKLLNSTTYRRLKSRWLNTVAMLAIGATVLAPAAFSQNIQIGTGTGTNTNLPITSCYGYTYSQQIYTQAQVNTAGSIDKIRFYFSSSSASGGSTANSLSWRVLMGQTTKSSFSSTTDWEPIANLTQVFNGTVTYPAAGNWMEISLTTPFSYNNINNLVIAVDENTASYDCSINWRSFTSATNTGIYYRNDVTNPDPASPPTASSRTGTLAQLQLHFVESPCTGTPMPGNTTGPVSVGSGDPVNLGLQNTTPGSGVTYQWYYSTTSSTGPWTAGGTAATYSPTQTVQSWYYCDVTCGASTTSSTVLQVGVMYCSSTSTSQASYFSNFATTGGLTNITNPSVASAGGYGDFTAQSVSQSANGLVNFTTTLVGTTVGVGIWVDWNNDLDFVDVGEQVYNTGGYVSTASGSFTVPAATPAGNYRMRIKMDYNGSTPTPCGLISRGETEDYTFTVAPPPACQAPSALSANNLTTSGADLNWTANGSATVWDLEIGATGFTPTGTPTVNDVAAHPYTWAGGASSTSYAFYVRSDCGMDNVNVSSWSGPFSFTTACNTFSVPFQEGFNSSSTTTSCWTVLNVNADADAWLLNYTGYAYEGDQSAGMYTDFNAGANDDWLISPAITLTGAEQLRYYYRVRSSGEPNDMSVLLSTTGTAPADFTTTLLPLTAYSNTTYAEKVISLTAYTGPVHIAWRVPPGGLDGYYLYVDNVNVEAAPTCPAPTSVTVSGTTSTTTNVNFSCVGCTGNVIVEYGPSGYTPGTGATAGVTGTLVSSSAISPQAISGLSATTTYNVYVRQDCSGSSNGYSVNSGLVSFTTTAAPPANDDCANAIALASCSGGTQTVSGTTVNSTVDVGYTNCGAGGTNATERGVWYTYVGDNNAVTITTCNSTGYDSRITVYSGTCGALVCEGANDDAGSACTISSLRSQVTFSALTGNTYYIFVHGYQSGTSLSATGAFVLSWSCASLCAPVPSNDMCANATALTVGAAATNGFNTCAVASVTNPSCESAFATLPDVFYSFTASASGVNQITITANTATNLGYAIYDACGGTEVGCVATVISGSPNIHSGLISGNTYYIRVETNDGSNGSFSIAVAQSFAPANDDCANATNLTVNPDYNCGSVVHGTVAGATASADVAACGGTPDDDVWYTFTATSTTHQIKLINITGSTTDMYISLNSGACGSLVNVGCSDPETYNATGLTIGTLYTVRVYTYTATTGQTSQFDICVGTQPPPPANDDCANATTLTVNPDYACGTMTHGTVASATASGDATSPCFGTADDDVWYKFTANGTSQQIKLLNVTGSSTDMYMAVYSGACGSLVSIGCSDPNTFTAVGLTNGSTYYVRVYTYTSTSGQDTQFDICVGTPPPPPANDNCANASALTVNADYNCGAVTHGTVASATASGDATSPCFGTPDDDVWYKFTATSPNHRVTLTNVTGSSTDMYMAVYSGACGSLVNVACSDPNSLDLTGLVVSNTYYVRVYTYTSTTGQDTQFDICIGTGPALDLGATALVAPGTGGCYGAAEQVTVTIKNFGSQPVNFVTNPTTVTTNVSGPVTQSLSVLVNTGTLAVGATMNAIMSTTLNMTTQGTYNFGANTSVTGDAVSTNDAMAATTRTVANAVAVPYTQNFDANTSIPTGWTASGWTVGAGGNPGNSLYKEFYTSTPGEFTVINVGPLPAATNLKFDYVMTDWYYGDALPNSPAWGSMDVQISTDCGVNYTTLGSINPSNHISSTAWATKTYQLGAYVGQTVKVRILVNRTAGDWYVDFDNFNFVVPPALDMGAIALATPSGVMCPNPAQPVNVTIQNLGSATVDYAVNPVTVSAGVTGAATVTFTPVVLGTGTLAAGATQNVLMGNLDMSAGGTYTFTANTAVTGDADATNNAMPAASRTVNAATATALPYLQDFSAGTTTPPNWNTTGWLIASSHGQADNGLYKNLWSSAPMGEFTMPKLGTVSASTLLTFDYRLVNFTSYPGTALPNAPAWGSIDVKVSSDCGATFTTVQTISPSNHLSSTSWANKSISLAAYDGQDVIIKFTANWTAGDWYADFDNFNVGTGCTGTPDAGVSTASAVGVCENTSVTLTNNGTNTALGITYQWKQSSGNSNGPYNNVTGGTGSTTLSYTTDPLALGTYYYRLYTYCAGGSTAYSNTVTVTSSAVPTVTATAAGPTSFCAGGSVNIASSAGGSYLWSPNGETTQSISATTGGSYSVTTSVNGCEGTSAPVVVSITNSPTGVTANASSLLECPGGVIDLTSTGTTANTQSIFSEGFNGASLPAGWVAGGTNPGAAAWTMVSDGYTYDATLHSNDASQFMLSNNDPVLGASSSSLTSPAINLTGYYGASVEFYHYLNTFGATGTVEASTDGTSWTTVAVYSTPTGTATDFDHAILPLGAAFDGQATVYVRFVFDAFYDLYWAIDNVSILVSTPPTFSWSSTPAGFTSNQQNPTNVTVTSTPVTYTVTASTSGCTATANVTVNPAGHLAVMRINTDANASQISWEIKDAANVTVASGTPVGNNQQVNQNLCLSNANGDCYTLKLTDSFGDGINNGGWELRTMGGLTILKDAFASGGVSPANPTLTATYGGGHPFCLPLGNASVLPTECGLFNNTLNNRIYGNTVPGATQYEFQFLDPDAGYVRSIVKGSATMQFINLGGSVNALLPGVKYFVRVRTNANGPLASAHYGPGCEMGMSATAVVHCTQLINGTLYGHSCNETRAFGSSSSSFIYATPVLGASAYTFHIYVQGEPTLFDTTITRSTYILQLKWPGTPMANGSTYNVDVKTTVNGVQSNYCLPYCTITIDNGYTGTINALTQVDGSFGGDVQLWPNPVADGRVNLALNGLVDSDQKIQVDLYDMYGKKVLASEYGNSGNSFSTVLELPSEVTSGVYLVHLTVNGVTTVQRLSVVR